jgi:serine/threonine protein kinase
MRPPELSISTARDLRAELCQDHNLEHCGVIVAQATGVIHHVRNSAGHFVLKIAKSDETFLTREFSALMLLDHPCIPKPVLLRRATNVWEQECLVMTFMDGSTLQQLLHRGVSFARQELNSIAHQLCDGLIHAHERSIDHRDVALDNLMYDQRSGRLAIIDWNYARCPLPKYLDREVVTSFGKEVGFAPSPPSDLPKPGSVPLSGPISGGEPRDLSPDDGCLSPYGKFEYRAPTNEEGSWVQQDAYATGVVIAALGAEGRLREIAMALCGPLDARLKLEAARDAIQELMAGEV